MPIDDHDMAGVFGAEHLGEASAFVEQDGERVAAPFGFGAVAIEGRAALGIDAIKADALFAEVARDAAQPFVVELQDMAIGRKENYDGVPFGSSWKDFVHGAVGTRQLFR